MALPSEPPPVLHLIGDSTLADKRVADGNPERGWGMLLHEYVAPAVRIANHAQDGRSSKSFIDEGLWAGVLAALRPGHWLVIQFGHNDQKHEDPLRYTDPATTYRDNLARFVREAVAEGVHPIFATSIYRRRFTTEERPLASLGDYPAAMRQLAAELRVPLIDLNADTRALLAALGPEKSKPLFLHFVPGEHPFYPNGKTDDTHLSLAGARVIAGFFAHGLRRQHLDLARWITDPPAPPTTKLQGIEM